MKIYNINVKDFNNNQYSQFIVLGETINDMLENLYKELIPEQKQIPYYLRSSNFIITCLGDITLNEKIKIKNKVLCKRYENWNE